MRLKPNAPRFHARLERKQGKSVFIIRRSTWDSLKFRSGDICLLTTQELAETALANAPVVCGWRRLEGRGARVELSIYRIDSDDHLNLINVDSYTVWEELPITIDIPRIVNEATTSLDANFMRYLGEHVFLVKEGVGPGHHLPALPAEVTGARLHSV